MNKEEKIEGTWEDVFKASVFIMIIAVIIVLVYWWSKPVAQLSDSVTPLLSVVNNSANVLTKQDLEIQTEMDDIIHALPEKDKCRILDAKQTRQQNQGFFTVRIFNNSCQKWLEKVPEHYVLP